MLTWPHEQTDWAERLGQVEPVFAHIATAITRDEPLLCVCRDEPHRKRIERLLEAAGANPDRLRFGLSPSNDSWARDHGPLTTLDDDDRPLLHDFRFDGWGGKFPAALDDAVTRRLYRQGCFGDTPLRTHPLVLEGGAIETDGLGTLLATRSSILDPARNPTWDETRITALLGDTLGLERFLWLDHGEITGDDTDAHIDVLARFVDAHTIVHATAPPGDPDHPALTAMARQLATFDGRSGRPYQLVPLPFPGVHLDEDGRRLPASYANFLITNRSLLLPTYGLEADGEAVRALQRCFPGRKVIPVDCRPIIRQNGSLHCLTMQFPQAVPLCGNGNQEIAAS